LIWWLGTLGAYITLMFILGPHFKNSEAFPYIAFAGFLLANFIGIGLGTHSKGEPGADAVKRGLVFGSQWLAMMLVWGAVIGAIIGLYWLGS
jgi:hypothetical protein